MKDVKAAFKKYDRNADGSISKGELNHALTNYKFNFSDQVKSIYRYKVFCLFVCPIITHEPIYRFASNFD